MLTMLTMGMLWRMNSDPVSPVTSPYTMKQMTAASHNATQQRSSQFDPVSRTTL